MKFWAWGLTLFWIISDQLTKWWAIHWLKPRGSVEVIPGFWNWTYVENTGVAFGFLQGHNEILAIVVFIILGFSIWIAREFDWSLRSVNFVGSMILGGAIGNILDRFQHGYVIDFVDWHYRGWHWPAFNIADSLICISMACLIFYQFRATQK